MAATITYLQTATDGTNTSSYSFTSQNISTASSDRRIICTVTAQGAGLETLSSVTIGGVSATIVKTQANSTTSLVAVAIALVPTGTTATVDVVFSGTMGDCAISLYHTTGVGSNTATDTGGSTANPLTYALDVVAGGVAVAIAKSQDGAATATWAGLTERFDEQDGNTNDISGASDAFASTQTNLTVSCTWTGSTTPCYAVASFPPADPGPANLKSLDTNVKANIKSYNTNVLANIKSINGNA